MRADALHRLRVLADLLRDREEAALRALQGRIHALDTEIQALRDMPHPPDGAEITPATRAGADARWTAWRDAELGRLQARKAELMAELLERRATAARAIGRSEALKRIEGP